MAVWLVRAGKNGERENAALEEGLALIGWGELPDLSAVTSREELMKLCQDTYPTENPKRIINWVGQLWAFVRRIEVGDLIVLPLKARAAIALGRVTGPYRYRHDLPADARHTRPVEWLRKDIPRTAFDQDILYSFGALMTVCQIRRNNAEERIEAVLEGRLSTMGPKITEILDPEEDALPNVEEYAQDQIRTYIDRKFTGHDLARLITALLKAQGYQTYTASPGPDGGADIMAGRGPMGFDPPRLCVQVKSGSQPADVKVLRELQGVMRNFGAEQGLLVSWGGFKSTVVIEASRLFFQVRLWDSGDVIQTLMEHYDQLPEDLQAELPLKRIWTLVQEEAQ